MKKTNVCLLFQELKLTTKLCTANERTHLFILLDVQRKLTKKQWTCRWEKIRKGIEGNRLIVMIKRLLWEFNLYSKFMCVDENNN